MVGLRLTSLMGYRKLKLILFNENPYCHWCGEKTTLTNVSHIKGQPDPMMATIDHVISKYDPRRWVKGQQKKVLACFKCNARRSAEETERLGREEIVRRSTTGFSFDRVSGKTIFEKPLETLDEVLDKLKEHGKLAEYAKISNAS